jgi:hypothetical protein
MPRRKRSSDLAARWKARVTKWEASGLSQREFCAREGFCAGTFAWWKHQLTHAPASARNRLHRIPAFVRIQPAAPVISSLTRTSVTDPDKQADRVVTSAALEILLPDGVRLRIGSDCDAELLDRALSLLRAKAC